MLKDSTLYRYSAPIDDMTESVMQLPGYRVTSGEAEPASASLVLRLQHKVQHTGTGHTSSEGDSFDHRKDWKIGK